MSRLSPLNRGARAPIRIDPRNPRAVAMCQGCGFWVMHSELRQSMDYRGGWSPVPTGLWVCATCDDVPQPYFQRQVLPPDPIPVPHAFPDPNVTLPTYGSVTATQLATQGVWINAVFPPASTTTTQGFTTASDLNSEGIW